MSKKYPELVQFVKENSNDEQMQKAINEYQYFAKVYSEIDYTLRFDIKNLDHNIRDRLDINDKELLEHPKLSQVIEEVKLEFAESIFFHSNDLNQEVYNYAWQIYQEVLAAKAKSKALAKAKEASS